MGHIGLHVRSIFKSDVNWTRGSKIYRFKSERMGALYSLSFQLIAI